MTRIATVLLLTSFMTGCDSGVEPAPVPLGTFEVRLGGAADVQFGGDAYFIAPSGAPVVESPFTIQLVATTASAPGGQGVMITDLDSVLNRTGTYVLGPEADVEVKYVELGGQRGRIDHVIEGTLEIATFANDRVVGTVEARLETRNDTLPDVLEVSFAAVPPPTR